MTDKLHHCKFCELPIDINKTYADSVSDTYECLECEVNYYFHNDSLAVMSYDIDDGKYLFIMMDFPENKTYIYLTANSLIKDPTIEVDGVYPDIHPTDIIAFADRIYNLKAFL